MTILDKLKELLKDAMKSKDDISKGILRLVIADIEKDFKRAGSDDWAQSVIRKHLKQNTESLAFFKGDQVGYHRLIEQSALIESLLPKSLSVEEIEHELFSSLNGEVKDIRQAHNDGQAMGIAMKFFKSRGQNVLGPDVK